MFVAGYFSGTVDFGRGPLTSAGISDVFVLKYDSAGVLQWSQRFGGTGADNARGLSVDSNGDVLVTGFFSATVDFGGGPLTSAGGKDVYLLKLSGATGSHLWSKRFGDATDDIAYGVATRGSSEVALTGYFKNTVDFGCGAFASYAGTSAVFVAKFDDSDGHCLWSKTPASYSASMGNAVAMDGSGNVLLTGTYQDTVDFGGGAMTSAGDYDVFVAKLAASSGAYVWSKNFGDVNFDGGYGVAADSAGNALVTGAFTGRVGFGGTTFTSAGLQDIFLVKLSAANGSHLWSQRFGDVSSDYAYGVAVDQGDNVVIGGYFQGNVNFGSGAMTSAGGSDLFVARFSGAGAPLWSKRFGGTNFDYGYAIDVDGAGNPVTAGSFMSSANFGSGADAVSAGSADGFVVKLAQ